MTKIDNLTEDDILNGSLPLKVLLNNSFYYPASGFDGGIVKYYSKHIQSFIYCDYLLKEDDLIEKLDTFHGYRVLGHRSVKKEELTPRGWQMRPPPHFDIKQYNLFKDDSIKPFAHWIVYERHEKYDQKHGPEKLSLLYIGGEGIAKYQALYWANKMTAKALAIIQPSGCNWTDFRDRNGALAWVVMNNEYGTPDTIFYGGWGNDYDDFNWNEYQYEYRIRPYFIGKVSEKEKAYGEVTIWEKKNQK